MQVPAVCLNCGAMFPSAIPFMPGLTTKGNIQNCPFCPGAAAIADVQVFDVVGDTITILSASNITRQKLREYEALLRAVYKREITFIDFEQRARAIDGSLGKVAGIVRSTPYQYTFILLLILAIKSCNFEMSASLNVNELIDQLSGRSPALILQDEASPSEKRDDAKRQKSSHDARAASSSANPKRKRTGIRRPHGKL